MEMTGEYVPSPLLVAVVQANFEEVKNLLESGVDVNALDPEENVPALFYAFQSLRLDLVELLMKYGANFTEHDNRKKEQRMMEKVILSGNIDLIEKLFIAGFKEKDLMNQVLLSGKVVLIEKLVAGGVDINLSLDSRLQTALHIAAAESSKEMVQKLIELGADVNAIDYENNNPLLVATFNGKLENFEALLANGSNINVIGAQYPHQCNCCPEDFNPLMAAFESGNEDLIFRVLDAGADMNVLQPYSNATLLNMAANEKSKDFVLKLIQYGAKVNALDKNGENPLLPAVKGSRLENVRVLIENGADVNLPNAFGELPLICAVKLGNLEIVKVLIENGADVNVENGLALKIVKNKNISKLLKSLCAK